MAKLMVRCSSRRLFRLFVFIFVCLFESFKMFIGTLLDKIIAKDVKIRVEVGDGGWVGEGRRSTSGYRLE